MPSEEGRAQRANYFSHTEDGMAFKEHEREIVSRWRERTEEREQEARAYFVMSGRQAVSGSRGEKRRSSLQSRGKSSIPSVVGSPPVQSPLQSPLSAATSTVDRQSNRTRSVLLPQLNKSQTNNSAYLLSPLSSGLKTGQSFMLGRDGKEFRRPSTFDIFGELRPAPIKSRFTKHPTSVPAHNTRARGLRSDDTRNLDTRKGKHISQPGTMDFKIIPTSLNFGTVVVDRKYSLKLVVQNLASAFLRFNVVVCSPNQPPRRMNGFRYDNQKVLVSPRFVAGPIPGGLSRHIDVELLAICPGKVEDIELEVETPHCVYRLPIRCEVVKRVDSQLESLGPSVTPLTNHY